MPSKVVQFRRGTTQQNQAFVGAEGELTIDLDKKTVVVHDGITPGGYPLKREIQTYLRQRYITFRAAVVQFGVPILGFSCADNAPLPVPVPVENHVGITLGAASFAPGVLQTVQDHLMIPSNFVGPLGLEIMWRCEETFGDVHWQIEIGGLAPNQTVDGTLFNSQIVQATVPEVPYGVVLTQIAELPISSIILNRQGEAFFKFSRLPDDNIAAPVELLSLRFILTVAEN